MNDQFEMQRTDLANEFGKAGAALLNHMNCAGAVAAIPGSEPEEYAIAGSIRSIISLANTMQEANAGASIPPLTAPAPLTDEKIVQLANEHDDPEFGLQAFPFARAIEAEVAKAAPAAPVQTDEQAQKEEILALHRQLAAEKLRADQGWERAEAKSKECIEIRDRFAALPAQAEQVEAVRAAYENAAKVADSFYDHIRQYTTDVPAIGSAIRALAAPSTTPSNDTSALGDTGGAK